MNFGSQDTNLCDPPWDPDKHLGPVMKAWRNWHTHGALNSASYGHMGSNPIAFTTANRQKKGGRL